MGVTPLKKTVSYHPSPPSNCATLPIDSFVLDNDRPSEQALTFVLEFLTHLILSNFNNMNKKIAQFISDHQHDPSFAFILPSFQSLQTLSHTFSSTINSASYHSSIKDAVTFIYDSIDTLACQPPANGRVSSQFLKQLLNFQKYKPHLSQYFSSSVLIIPDFNQLPQFDSLSIDTEALISYDFLRHWLLDFFYTDPSLRDICQFKPSGSTSVIVETSYSDYGRRLLEKLLDFIHPTLSHAHSIVDGPISTGKQLLVESGLHAIQDYHRLTAIILNKLQDTPSLIMQRDHTDTPFFLWAIMHHNRVTLPWNLSILTLIFSQCMKNPAFMDSLLMSSSFSEPFSTMLTQCVSEHALHHLENEMLYAADGDMISIISDCLNAVSAFHQHVDDPGTRFNNKRQLSSNLSHFKNRISYFQSILEIWPIYDDEMLPSDFKAKLLRPVLEKAGIIYQGMIHFNQTSYHIKAPFLNAECEKKLLPLLKQWTQFRLDDMVELAEYKGLPIRALKRLRFTLHPPVFSKSSPLLDMITSLIESTKNTKAVKVLVFHMFHHLYALMQPGPEFATGDLTQLFNCKSITKKKDLIAWFLNTLSELYADLPINIRISKMNDSLAASKDFQLSPSSAYREGKQYVRHDIVQESLVTMDLPDGVTLTNILSHIQLLLDEIDSTSKPSIIGDSIRFFKNNMNKKKKGKKTDTFKFAFNWSDQRVYSRMECLKKLNCFISRYLTPWLETHLHFDSQLLSGHTYCEEILSKKQQLLKRIETNMQKESTTIIHRFYFNVCQSSIRMRHRHATIIQQYIRRSNATHLLKKMRQQSKTEELENELMHRSLMALEDQIATSMRLESRREHQECLTLLDEDIHSHQMVHLERHYAALSITQIIHSHIEKVRAPRKQIVDELTAMYRFINVLNIDPSAQTHRISSLSGFKHIMLDPTLFKFMNQSTTYEIVIKDESPSLRILDYQEPKYNELIPAFIETLRYHFSSLQRIQHSLNNIQLTDSRQQIQHDRELLLFKNHYHFFNLNSKYLSLLTHDIIHHHSHSAPPIDPQRVNSMFNKNKATATQLLQMFHSLFFEWVHLPSYASVVQSWISVLRCQLTILNHIDPIHLELFDRYNRRLYAQTCQAKSFLNDVLHTVKPPNWQS